jgi:hypothetical protein
VGLKTIQKEGHMSMSEEVSFSPTRELLSNSNSRTSMKQLKELFVKKIGIVMTE